MSARGSYKKSEASRKQVLDAAIRELATRGYAKTSVSDIAAAAGMSKGAVHYHFESKDDLIAQVLVQCSQVMTDRARAAWEIPGAPADRVRRALNEMRVMRRDGGEEQRVFADLMAQGIHDARLRKPIAATLEASRREIVEQLVLRLKELGLEPKIPARAFARLLLGSLDGLALHEFFGPLTEDQDAELQAALEGIAFWLLNPS